MKERMEKFVKDHRNLLFVILIAAAVGVLTLTVVLAAKSVLRENSTVQYQKSPVGTVTDALASDTDTAASDTDASMPVADAGDPAVLLEETTEAESETETEPETEPETETEESATSKDKNAAASGNTTASENSTTASGSGDSASGNSASSDDDDVYTGVEVTDELLEQYAYDVIDLINALREEEGLQPFEINDDLMTAASIRVTEYTQNYQEVHAHVEKYGFGHPRPDGRDSDTVMEDLGYTNLGYCISVYYSDDDTSGKYIFSYNENLARGQMTPADAVEAWMADAHKYLILDEGTSLYEDIEVNAIYEDSMMSISYMSGSLTGTDSIGAAVVYVNGTYYWAVSTACMPHVHDFSGEAKSMMDNETYKTAMYYFHDLDNMTGDQLVYILDEDVPGYGTRIGLNRAQYITYLTKEASYYACSHCGAIKWAYRTSD